MEQQFMDDPVIGSQPFTCKGKVMAKQTLFGFGPIKWEPKHNEPEQAVLIVHRSGRTRVVCPICGSWENTR